MSNEVKCPALTKELRYQRELHDPSLNKYNFGAGDQEEKKAANYELLVERFVNSSVVKIININHKITVFPV